MVQETSELSYSWHLPRILKERGLSLTGLAELARVDKGALSRINHGMTAPTFETVARLAIALDLPAEAIAEVRRPAPAVVEAAAQ